MRETTPRNGDILIRRERRDEAWAFVMCTLPGPDQFTLPTRDAATAAAVAVARREQVCVWLADASGAFTLLNDFRGIPPRMPQPNNARRVNSARSKDHAENH